MLPQLIVLKRLCQTSVRRLSFKNRVSLSVSSNTSYSCPFDHQSCAKHGHRVNIRCKCTLLHGNEHVLWMRQLAFTFFFSPCKVRSEAVTILQLRNYTHDMEFLKSQLVSSKLLTRSPAIMRVVNEAYTWRCGVWTNIFTLCLTSLRGIHVNVYIFTLLSRVALHVEDLCQALWAYSRI